MLCLKKWCTDFAHPWSMQMKGRLPTLMRSIHPTKGRGVWPSCRFISCLYCANLRMKLLWPQVLQNQTAATVFGLATDSVFILLCNMARDRSGSASRSSCGYCKVQGCPFATAISKLSTIAPIQQQIVTLETVRCAQTALWICGQHMSIPNCPWRMSYTSFAQELRRRKHSHKGTANGSENRSYTCVDIYIHTIYTHSSHKSQTEPVSRGPSIWKAWAASLAMPALYGVKWVTQVDTGQQQVSESTSSILIRCAKWTGSSFSSTPSFLCWETLGPHKSEQQEFVNYWLLLNEVLC